MRMQWMNYQTDFDYAAGLAWDTVIDEVETLCMKALDHPVLENELSQENTQCEMLRFDSAPL